MICVVLWKNHISGLLKFRKLQLLVLVVGFWLGLSCLVRNSPLGNIPTYNLKPTTYNQVLSKSQTGESWIQFTIIRQSTKIGYDYSVFYCILFTNDYPN